MKKNGEETITQLGSMKIIQRNDFQNFTLDSVLLSDFVKINRKAKKILDIGTGCGIIALILADRSKSEITGVELQEKMCEIAQRNVESNGFSERVEIINGDIGNYRELFKRDEFDIVVTNPPYFEFNGNTDQINSLSQLAKARHNVDLSLEEVVKCSAYLLKNSGSFNIVFRSSRLAEILEIVKKYRLEPKRIRNIYTRNNTDAKICLLECIKDARKGLKIEYPVFVYDENGEKSEYIKGLYKQQLVKP